MGLQWRLRRRSLKGFPWVTIAILALKSAKTLWSAGKNHESISQIARKLGRNKSSISREIKRNGWTIIGVTHLCYRASTAQRKADVRRQACKKQILLDDDAMQKSKIQQKIHVVNLKRWCKEIVLHHCLRRGFVSNCTSFPNVRCIQVPFFHSLVRN